MSRTLALLFHLKASWATEPSVPSWMFGAPLQKGGWSSTVFQGPFQPKPFYDSLRRTLGRGLCWQAAAGRRVTGTELLQPALTYAAAADFIPQQAWRGRAGPSARFAPRQNKNGGSGDREAVVVVWGPLLALSGADRASSRPKPRQSRAESGTLPQLPGGVEPEPEPEPGVGRGCSPRGEEAAEPRWEAAGGGGGLAGAWGLRSRGVPALSRVLVSFLVSASNALRGF